jgi:hypothetical protein
MAYEVTHSAEPHPELDRVVAAVTYLQALALRHAAPGVSLDDGSIVRIETLDRFSSSIADIDLHQPTGQEEWYPRLTVMPNGASGFESHAVMGVDSLAYLPPAGPEEMRGIAGLDVLGERLESLICDVLRPRFLPPTIGLVNLSVGPAFEVPNHPRKLA